MKRLVMSSILVAAMCAPALAEPLADPFESWNRSIFEFNERADRYVLKPVAQGYDAITPEPVQQGVRNFFNNLGEPVTVVNALLQGKPEKAARSLTRFVFNSTIGLYGLFDVAGGMGLERDDEDFGQTLAMWGVGSGPYLVLPILGPSDVRGLSGRIVDRPLNPVDWQDEVGQTELFVLNGVDRRASFIGLEPATAGDPYVLMRSAYQQRRDYKINDGIVVDLFLDDPFADDSPLE
ncbi:MAG: VacJ family lipoprotein [Litorivicinaceae bacterium]|jgi:phospholipid-binding lipoprotein MlaA|nr:VacJ family lipoprotein [Litorivicinaceae bacterium]MDP5330913.1 VacJ family lipoprotein [Litorivicinaceae bacterium]MDP5340588.1 VacJ family lipoprotein [Litorivicinaceae bacterium]MDP5342155.1 VacJ family lipoprotein [Litorivicinaceae bacterium]MDP5344088.1 VacJ family lipoprotein [Litorivicinaceae bacterium]